MKKLPKTLMVGIARQGTDEEWFSADKNLDQLVTGLDEDSVPVGEYRLVRTFIAKRKVEIVMKSVKSVNHK